jgi:dsDNA-specific endonuclease/ATPase MutS2
VLIIHGIGSGRLKDEVHHMLSKMGKLNYYFADFADGGYGATEVEILLSKH